MKRRKTLDQARSRAPEAGEKSRRSGGRILWERFIDAPLFKKTEVIFWLIYLFAPMFTGWLDYQSLPNEYYDPTRHTLLKSHVKNAWPDGLGTYAVPDMWRDDANGTAYTAESFSLHHRSEAQRLGLAWFAYGLLGCAFFAYSRAAKSQSGFFTAFRTAAIIDVGVALFVFWIT